MDQDASGARAERFSAYIDDLASVLGDPRRRGPMRSYCTGLLMPADRKSVEPMAAMTAPDRTAAQHQSLLHFVGKGEWPDEAVMAKIRGHVVPQIEAHGAISVWIIDDTGFPKKGKHSAGVMSEPCCAWTRGNTAASWESRIIARWLSRCRLPTIMRACPSPTLCICRTAGQKTRKGA